MENPTRPDIRWFPFPAPYEGSELVAIAIRADHPGNYYGLGVVLRWRSDGEIHTAYQPVGFNLCVGAVKCDTSAVMKRMEALDMRKALTAPSI